MANSLRTLQTFTSFPHLPAEIRQEIWELSMVDPRIVEVEYSRYSFKNGSNATYSSATPVPAILHVHKESHILGLKKYCLHFSSTTDRIFGRLPTVYLDPSTDKVYLKASQSSLGAFHNTAQDLFDAVYWLAISKEYKPFTINAITKLAIPISTVLGNRGNLVYAVENISTIPNLSQLILVGDEFEKEIEEEEEGIEVKILKRYERKSYFEDAGDLAEPGWGQLVASVSNQFLEYRSQHRGKKLRQPEISILFLVKVREIAVKTDS